MHIPFLISTCGTGFALKNIKIDGMLTQERPWGKSHAEEMKVAKEKPAKKEM